MPPGFRQSIRHASDAAARQRLLDLLAPVVTDGGLRPRGRHGQRGRPAQPRPGDRRRRRRHRSRRASPTSAGPCPTRSTPTRRPGGSRVRRRRTCSRSARRASTGRCTEPRHWRRAVGRLVGRSTIGDADASPGGSRRPTTTACTLDVDGAPARGRVGRRSAAARVQVEFNRRREAQEWLSHGPRRHRRAAQHRAGEGDLLRDADRRARDRAAHRLQAHPALDAARARRDRPQDRRGRRLGAGVRPGR